MPHGDTGDTEDTKDTRDTEDTRDTKDTRDSREHRRHTPTKVKSQSIPLKCLLPLRKFVIECINKNRIFDFAFQVD